MTSATLDRQTLRVGMAAPLNLFDQRLKEVARPIKGQRIFFSKWSEVIDRQSEKWKWVIKTLAAGRQPLISFKMGRTWKDCAAGALDAEYLAAVDHFDGLCEGYGILGLVTEHHEPSGEEEASNGGPQFWGLMLLHYQDALDAERTRLPGAFRWIAHGCVNNGFRYHAKGNKGGDGGFGFTETDWKRLDFVGADFYDKSENVLADTLLRFLKQMQGRGVKNLVVGEIGCTEPAVWRQCANVFLNNANVFKHVSAFNSERNVAAGLDPSIWLLRGANLVEFQRFFDAVPKPAPTPDPDPEPEPEPEPTDPRDARIAALEAELAERRQEAAGYENTISALQEERNVARQHLATANQVISDNVEAMQSAVATLNEQIEPLTGATEVVDR